MIKLSSQTSFYVFAAATVAIAAAVGAAGLLMLTPTGEQSKLKFDTDLWCVSNYIEKEPQEIVRGRPVKDDLLIGKDDWIRREQVKAKSKEEAEAKVEAQYGQFFARSDKTALRDALTKNNKDFFIHHYNGAGAGLNYGGATAAGPCEGTGDFANDQGQWLADAARQECFKITDPNSQYEVVKKLNVTVTGYSPCVGSNTCDCPVSMGGGAATSDGRGSFKMQNGRLRWVKNDGTSEDYVFAEPSSNNIIAFDNTSLDRYAIIVPGFNNNQPIHVRDHYAPGNHAGSNYLDLFAPCGSEYNNLPTGSREVLVVDTQKPISTTTPADDKKDPRCPKEQPAAGPMAGEDYRAEIAQALQEQLQVQNAANYGSGQNITGQGQCALPIPGNTHASGWGGYRGKAQHRGYDFSAPTGTPVVAIMDGEVVLSEDFFQDGTGKYGSTSQNGGYGNRIKIKHDNGLYSEYHHLSHGSLLPVGARVKKGQTIAKVDNNGWSSGSHLHFQLMNGPSTESDWINPQACLGI